MKIGLLTVGTEILLGDTLNTNLSSLGNILYNSGFTLSTELTVSDDEVEITDGFKYVESKNDVIIICGGLGPTEVDITKEDVEQISKNLIPYSEDLVINPDFWESGLFGIVQIIVIKHIADLLIHN